MGPLCTGVLELAERRWTALSDADAGLVPAVELQRRLVGELAALIERLEQLPGLTPSKDPVVLAEKLQRGVPTLRGEPIELPMAVLAPSLDRFCGYLADSGAGEVARHLIETFESGRLSRASLLGASLARNHRAIRQGAMQMGLSPDLMWLVGELATAPVAYVLQNRLFGDPQKGSASQVVQLALAAWDRGYCPACGSWPALAENVAGVRFLRCSFCGSSWEMRSLRCVYCSEGDSAFRTITPDAASPGYVLELCDQCGGYTKAPRVTTLTPFLLLAIEDLETFALDRAAANQGYGRPPLPELGPEATYEPPRPCEGWKP